ncbi:phage major capsid protein [Mycobacterium avium]|uniref:phage major capsid protein n=1 Tax=Mycobacterium avium TaxID=1764 RepID=UPI001CC7CF8A|nr:phage major capsid protein [Mycobacterium avium]MBZ4537769.1 phage major capsid protein [Mycobacterium avium subsp. hominissuis]MBZ4594931.1 phage major capsid protein [Mycobacterium avium subsp. hominissuis]MBZ4637669.1 phage major capsid protein [Mycobacterium avium subsp. hominissuis]
MSVTNTGLDQAFTPESYGKLVDTVIESNSIAFNPAVATTLNISTESIRIPLLTADVSSGWYDELDSITEADPTTDELVVTPKGVKAYTLVSNESVSDTQPAIANLIGNSIGRSIAKKVDAALFSLTAVTKGPQLPLGVVAYSYVDIAVASATFDHVLEAIKLSKDNGANPTAVVVNPAVELQWRQVKTASGYASYLVQDQLLADEQRRAGYAGFTIGGVPVYVSRAVDALTAAWVVDASQVFTVRRQVTQIVADKSAAFQQDGTAVRGVARVDFGVTNPAGVVRLFDHA